MKQFVSRIIEVIKINDSVLNMKKGLRSFKKYVPADLVRQLNDLQKEAVLGGEKKTLTIFFSDIADFTTISEQFVNRGPGREPGHLFPWDEQYHPPERRHHRQIHRRCHHGLLGRTRSTEPIMPPWPA